jgi:conjugative transfer region protein TrbK
MAIAQLISPRLFVVAGAGITILAAGAIELRSKGDDIAARPVAPSKADALDIKLTRCRTVIPEQTEAYEQCRRIWTDNRRRFFGKDQSRADGPEVKGSEQDSKTQALELAR